MGLPPCERHGREHRVHRRALREDSCVRDREVVEAVAEAFLVDHAPLRIASTKWLIKTLETLRLAKGLRTASDLHIFRARLDIQRAQAEQRLAGLSHELHERMKGKIHNAYEALLAAYGSWRDLKQEYRSIRRTLGHKRKELTLKLKRDLQRASSNYMLTRASWALVSTRNPFSEGPVG